MEQVKTFEHNDLAELDNLVNGFLEEIGNKGYDLLELYYNSIWNHNQNYAEYSVTTMYVSRQIDAAPRRARRASPDRSPRRRAAR